MRISCSSSPPTGRSSLRAPWRAAPAASTRRSRCRCRNKLVQLYGRGLPLANAVVGEAAQRTKGVSAAFIKELMRRVAQASIARDGGTTVESGDISEALDDMLFAGGKLNVKLLGGAREMVDG
jgi:hypothetical protein